VTSAWKHLRLNANNFVTRSIGSGIEISDNDFKAAGTFVTSSVLNANVAKFSETREFFEVFAPFVPFAKFS